MPYKSEQERLAELIGQEEGFDQIQDGADMIFDELRKNISVDPNKVREIEEEIENHGDSISSVQRSSKASTEHYSSPSRRRVKLSEDLSVEHVLIELLDVHESLIGLFESLDFNSPLANATIASINKLGATIKMIGGVVEEFNPIDHVSGLISPDVFENIDKIIATTKRCYKAGDIVSISPVEDGDTLGISVVFEGYDKGSKISYRVDGNVFSDDWQGNEAIDYIYTPDGGKLSVKKYERGKWVDRSEEDQYQISWDLEETSRGELYEAQNPSEDMTTKNIDDEEVMEDIVSNKVTNNEGNEDVDLESDINEDFPIIRS